MSDFLTNLAARAIAPVPAVRPLVRSLYEEPVGFLAEAAGTPVPQSTGPRTAEVAPPESVHGAGSVAIGRGQDARTTSGAGILPAASPNPALRPAAAAKTVSTPETVRLADGRGLGQNARTTSGAGILPAASPPPPTASTPETVRFTDERGLGQDARTTSGAGMLPAALALPAASEPLPKLPQALPNKPPARATTAQGPPPAPVVTITIGRVEIRAVPPAAQDVAPAASTAGPRLSLETYLRRTATRPS